MMFIQKLFFIISYYCVELTRVIRYIVFDLKIELRAWIVSKSISQVLDKCMHINEFKFPRQTLFGKPLSSTV